MIATQTVPGARNPGQVSTAYTATRALADGKRARKVFKRATTRLAPGETAAFAGRHAFRQLSTRKYYPGLHVVECLVNGRTVGAVRFEVVSG